MNTEHEQNQELARHAVPTTAVVMLLPADKSRSSVQEELDALNWQLQQIMVSIGKISDCNDLVNEHEVEAIRRHINTAYQRSCRAEQCSRGMKVWKAT